MKKIIHAAIVAVMICGCTANSPQQKLASNDKKINRIISGMSLDEKVLMLHSKTIMSSEGIPRLGIQEIRYADGPFGIREEVGDSFRPLGWPNDYATYFPTGSALAATWSEDIAYLYGTGMGREARLRGKDVILGPAINIQRLPVGGRSYEYLSEDPFLSARLTVGYTKGAQEAGTAVCLKHFAVNNQETNRGSVNAVVDERTLREIYLKPFEAGVVEGGAMAIMTAYNKVNGAYCSENAHLNNDILRGEWGFNGLTVSDWGGTHSTMGAAFGGLDVQMTGDNYLGPALADSVRAGKVPESLIDDKVREILRVRFAVEAVPEDVANTQMTSQPEQQQIAYEVATKSIVLLKNTDSILPIDLSSVKRIAVIGENAEVKTALGGVGAGVKAPYEITALQGLKNRIGSSAEVVWSPDDPTAAAGADLVIFVGGTDRNQESESRDRRDIFLPDGQDSLVARIAAINPNLVSVILSGGPCDLRNVDALSKAVVQGWWNGMEGGNALADVLLGNISPSGKLPFTYPLKLEDSPAFALGVFPQKVIVEEDLFAGRYRQDLGGSGRRRTRYEPDALYSEGPLVGYRWYDTKDVPVLYPFGHGLSYADFSYSNLQVSKDAYGEGDIIKLSFDLSNTGFMAADEVAQLYVRRTGSKVSWPDKELKAFRRVNVGAGDTVTVKLEIPVDDLRWYNEDSKSWELEACGLELLLGSSSSDIRQSIKCTINK